APREISTHIEFAGISRWRYRLGSSKKLQFIAEFRRAFPTDLPDRTCGSFPIFELNGLELEQKRCKSARCDFWLSDYRADCCDNSWPTAKFIRELLALRVLSREIVQQEKTGSDNGICCDQPRPAHASENAECEDNRC